MKTPILFLTSVIVLAGCANSPFSKNESGKDIAATGPTVLNPRAVPGTVEMNQSLQPTQGAEILADVKDFKAQVKDVKLQFTSVPLEVAMRNIGGTTWEAELTPEQLQMLAVSGKTISYDANVIATDSNGLVSQSEKPVTVAIKTPDLAKSQG